MFSKGGQDASNKRSLLYARQIPSIVEGACEDMERGVVVVPRDGPRHPSVGGHSEMIGRRLRPLLIAHVCSIGFLHARTRG